MTKLTGILSNWEIKPAHADDTYTLGGDITQDDRERFADGTWVRTSRINAEDYPPADLKEGDIVKTLNSTYKLGPPKAEVPDTVKIHFPIRLEVKMYIVNPETGQEGTVGYSGPAFETMDDDQMRKALESAEGALPDGFRFMTRHETETHLLAEATGFAQVYALSKMKPGTEWYKPEEQNTHMTYHQSDEDE